MSDYDSVLLRLSTAVTKLVPASALERSALDRKAVAECSGSLHNGQEQRGGKLVLLNVNVKIIYI